MILSRVKSACEPSGPSVPVLIPVSVAFKWLGIFLLPPRCDPWSIAGLPSALNSPAPIYTPGWREGIVWVKCLAQEHNTMSRPGLKPGLLDPESSSLTMRPPRLPLSCQGKRKICSHKWLSLLYHHYRVCSRRGLNLIIALAQVSNAFIYCLPYFTYFVSGYTKRLFNLWHYVTYFTLLTGNIWKIIYLNFRETWLIIAVIYNLSSSNIWSFIYSFALFTFYGYITNSQCDQLPIGLKAHMVEHCTSMRLRFRIPFSGFNFRTAN